MELIEWLYLRKHQVGVICSKKFCYHKKIIIRRQIWKFWGPLLISTNQRDTDKNIFSTNCWIPWECMGQDIHPAEAKIYCLIFIFINISTQLSKFIQQPQVMFRVHCHNQSTFQKHIKYNNTKSSYTTTHSDDNYFNSTCNGKQTQRVILSRLPLSLKYKPTNKEKLECSYKLE